MLHLRNEILKIALPSIISNITVPLLGIVDTAIVGHLGAAAYIAAIAIGGLTFNVIYWLVSFLRMGTGGLTAQACGAADTAEALRILVRSLTVALGVAFVCIALQTLIVDAVMAFVCPDAAVEDSARSYIRILIWGSPAMMSLYSLNGWFLGMQNARYPMAVSIFQNVVNIVVSMVLVVGLGMKIEGVAFGTLCAQYAGFIAALWLWHRRYGGHLSATRLRGTWHRAAFARFFAVNRDIFLRTLCLVGVTMWFTAAGTAMGDVTLAANTLLMQFFIVFSYFMDGFAYAGEALGGRCVGARDREGYGRLAQRLFGWGCALACGFTLIYYAGGHLFLVFLTSDAAVRTAAMEQLPLVGLVPLVGFAAFLFDGLFIGATATRQMLLSMFVAAGTFFALRYGLPTGNACLWLAFLAYLALRGGMQALLYRGVTRHAFGN